MKILDDIPNNFESLDKNNLLGDSDIIEINDLKKFDKQLKKFNLELIVFENGSAYNWYITQRK